jgi:hypothetical protein
MSPSHVYQILNHYTSPSALDPGFLVLDNSANLRPDWYEYWPMRNFLLSQPLDDAAFYGFVSPKFKLKTNLSAADAHAFLRDAGDADVVLFSPSIQNTAYHLNVFTHGEAECPGLLAVSKDLFARLGIDTDLDAMISDSRNTVNSNYFVAKPRFWRAWLKITEALFAIAETPGDPLGARLSAPTSYRGRVETPMKIFVIERIASWLLAHDPDFVVRVRDPFVARKRIYKLPVAIICDALKIAYATTSRTQYREMFWLVQGLHRSLNWQVRIAGALRLRSVRPYLESLAAHWIDM